ncbi:MAG TPA: GntR family transcriptional regulator [Micromonosporaceae bacterium]|nr:GntR family transcriptional regulator [Micromonosporaceae bacterium]
MDLTSPPLTTVTVVDALVAAVRARILDGDLPPGTVLAEVRVARDYRVSRPTAKAALRQLVEQGLLRHDPHHPARVPALAAVDITDLFQIRTPLELVAIEQVAPRVAQRAGSLRGMVVAVHELRELDTEATHSQFVAADLRFHRELVDLAGSSRLSRIYAGLQGEIHLCMVQTRVALGRERIVHEHARILHALQQGDAVSAGDLMRAHLDGARAALLARFGGPGAGR